MRANPHAKQIIRTNLLKLLYFHAFEGLDTELKKIIINNTLRQTYTHKSFTYKDSLYSCVSAIPPRIKNRLLPALRPDMDAYLKSKAVLVKEEEAVSGFLTRMLNVSETLEDYLAILPETLHERVSKLVETIQCNSGHSSVSPFDTPLKSLTDNEVAFFKQKNQAYSDLIKNRMVLNLIV